MFIQTHSDSAGTVGGHTRGMVRSALERGARRYSRAEFSRIARRVDGHVVVSEAALAMRREALKFSRELAAHAEVRARSVERWGAQAGTPSAMVVEVLTDRVIKRGRLSEEGRRSRRVRVEQELDRGRLRVALLLLPRRARSPVKNRGVSPDLGEVSALVRMAEVGLALREMNVFGVGDAPRDHIRVQVIGVDDSYRYQTALRTPRCDVEDYQQALRRWVSALELGDCFALRRYSELTDQLSRQAPAMFEARNQTFARIAAEYRRKVAHVRDDDEACCNELVFRRRLAEIPGFEAIVPLFESLWFDRYPSELEEHCRREGLDYEQEYLEFMTRIYDPWPDVEREARRRECLWRTLEAAIDYRAAYESNTGELNEAGFDDVDFLLDHPLRASIHGKPEQVGHFSWIVGSSRTPKRCPWQGSAGLSLGRGGTLGLEIRTALEFEAAGYIPVCEHEPVMLSPNQPIFYLSPDAACALDGVMHRSCSDGSFDAAWVRSIFDRYRRKYR